MLGLIWTLSVLKPLTCSTVLSICQRNFALASIALSNFRCLRRQLAIYDVTHTHTQQYTRHNIQTAHTHTHTRRHLYWPHYNINLFVRFTLKKTQHSAADEGSLSSALAKCPSILAVSGSFRGKRHMQSDLKICWDLRMGIIKREHQMNLICVLNFSA